jgi:hypothetical protein
MFDYLFPIFCFGLVMTGIVFLGIIEAARQVKAEELKQDALKPHEVDLSPRLSAARPSSALRHPQHQ